MRSRRRPVHSRTSRAILKDRILLSLAGLALCAVVAGSARGSIAWEPVEPVDQPVTEVSSNSGASILYVDGAWHIVYCRDGVVCHRIRGASGWQEPETVSTVTGAVRDPHLTWDGTCLIVVWEDERTGIPEIWTRIWTAGGWAAEECLTEDAVPSRAPVIATCENHSLLVWQEEDVPSLIMGREFVAGWHDPVMISESTGSATEPTVGGVPYWVSDLEFEIAWTDTRHGAPEIYVRAISGGYLGEEIRRTDLPGVCGHPSINVDVSGGDMLYSLFAVCFEYTAPGGVPEIWAACNEHSLPHPLSPDDGIPSVRPGITDFRKPYEHCDWPFSLPQCLESWTDVGGARQHRVSVSGSGPCPAAGDSSELVSDSGLSITALAAAEEEPTAPLLALWVEDVSGVPTLLARRGGVPGCDVYGIEEERPLIVAPDGDPANNLRIVNTCTGDPIPNRDFVLHFSEALDQDLAWDPAQPHPEVPFSTDADGRAIVSLRGGGCSQTGTIWGGCGSSLGFLVSTGVRSPDLDGDCAVLDNDVATVRAAIGTDDFCADLDGSGLVDREDLRIVAGALGDRCAVPAGTSTPPDGSGGSLRIEPNPSRGPAVFQVRGALPQWRLRIFDLSGRVVRSLDGGPMATSADGSLRLTWDGKNDRGHPVPSGIYAIQVSGPAVQMRGTVIVLR